MVEFRIDGVRNRGEITRERLLIRAERAVDIGKYLLLSARTREGRILGSRVPNCYWFPDVEITAGDLVVLYSKSGSKNVRENNSGNHSHFFYWGLGEPVWDDPARAPVLVRIAAWNSFTGALSDSELAIES